ncbi:hypothetical protein ANN_11978 [Periplaneta americana]|uniref:Uncharacterized protein n=1 Tax=Periplaneta americana TaxID=6978 RepID=A0ABQ8T8F6_PERAM|nr:hypothetical protein ANN_11978 [Periplaneta americana]
MGRYKKFGKRKFYGNQFKSVENCPNRSDNGGSPNLTRPNSASESSSAKKLKHIFTDCNDKNSVSDNGYVIVHLSVLKELFNSYSKCKQCDSQDSASVCEDKSSRRGLSCCSSSLLNLESSAAGILSSLSGEHMFLVEKFRNSYIYGPRRKNGNMRDASINDEE